MFRLNHHKAVEFCDGWRRRDFLTAGSIGLLGLSDFLGLRARGAVRGDRDVNVILLTLVGGPSQLDTWDMKPDAPERIRGPYRPIRTNVSGIEISEIFPRTAQHADKYAILRTLHHDAAAVHNTGHQLMQTGRLFANGQPEPHIGCVAGRLKGGAAGMPGHVLASNPIGDMGCSLPHGQEAFSIDAPGADASSLNAADRRADWLGPVDNAIRRFEQGDGAAHTGPFLHSAYTELTSSRAREAFDLTRAAESDHERYGRNRFGQGCLLARRLTAAGVRFVTVNMFETVFDEITWDIHGSKPFSPIESYSDHVGPMFDMAYSSLLEDLHREGRLENTLVVATGEFGRTPRINPAGGRDHWTQCWSMLMAGGGVRGGQIIGESDAAASEPKERPISPAEVAATIYTTLGIDLKTKLQGEKAIVEPGVEPISELFV